MTQVYSIGGGKGGIGKTFLTANLGTLLAKQRKKVVLVDLDLGGSNLHTLFGFKRPKTGISKFINKSEDDLEKVAVATAIPNLDIINSMNCSMEIANLFSAQKDKIIKAVQNLSYDYVLLDLGAGTNFNTLDFFLSTNTGIFMCTPEPTSIENAFRFVKSVYVRKLKRILKKESFNAIINELSKKKDADPINASHIIGYINKINPENAEMLQNRLGEVKFKFIINQSRKQVDVTLGEKIEKVCNRHFYSEFQFLGYVSYDERVYESVSSKNIYINKYPYTATSTDLKNIVEKIMSNGN